MAVAVLLATVEVEVVAVILFLLLQQVLRISNRRQQLQHSPLLLLLQPLQIPRLSQHSELPQLPPLLPWRSRHRGVVKQLRQMSCPGTVCGQVPPSPSPLPRAQILQAARWSCDAFSQSSHE